MLSAHLRLAKENIFYSFSYFQNIFPHLILDEFPLLATLLLLLLLLLPLVGFFFFLLSEVLLLLLWLLAASVSVPPPLAMEEGVGEAEA